jgi:Na+-transporting NADH:ubiquinone oxidoreductase subunit C
VKDGDAIHQIVLPIHGYGLWSTLYGFIALESDLNTVVGLKYYEHTETAGLGAEVDNLAWLSQWKGRRVFDASGTPVLRVAKGASLATGDAALYEVDGLAGATLTSDGVTNMLHFWLGEQGFGPFLEYMRKRNGSP